jgi:predicted RNase H-related nuclease YkuK (DUF458 family)
MEQFAIGADETEINTPGIHCYAVYLVHRFGSGTNAFTNIVKEPESIPIETRWKLNWNVQKSMEFVKLDLSFGDLSQYGAPALRAQIKRKIMPVHRQ